MIGNHTPTPWRIRTIGGYCFIECPKESLGKAYGQEIMADDYFPELNKEADAAFIVEACNSYDKDKEVIKELAEALSNLLSFHMSPSLIEDNPERIAVKLAEKALSKSEGRNA